MTNKQILAEWDAAEEEFEDKSTEFLISIVVDRCGFDYEDVIEALISRAEEEEEE